MGSRREGTLADRLSYWRERLANAEELGHPKHIALVRERVDALTGLVAAAERERAKRPHDETPIEQEQER